MYSLSSHPPPPLLLSLSLSTEFFCSSGSPCRATEGNVPLPMWISALSSRNVNLRALTGF